MICQSQTPEACLVHHGLRDSANVLTREYDMQALMCLILVFVYIKGEIKWAYSRVIQGHMQKANYQEQHANNLAQPTDYSKHHAISNHSQQHDKNSQQCANF